MSDDALPRRATLVINANSRRGAEAVEPAKAKLRAAGIDLAEAHACADTEHLREAARDAIARGSPMVIVGGGDGTLSTVVDEFMGSESVFAVLPLGTANSFARTLGVPRDLDGAIQVIATGRRKRIDLGVIDGDYFANAAAMGLSPLIAQSVPHKLKKWLGIFGYVLWGIRVALKFRPFHLHVDDGTRIDKVWATEARIANGAYHGGVELIESARLDSGEIVVQAVTGRSILGLAWSWFATVLKLRARHGTVTEFRGPRLRLEAHPRQKISIDGEVAARTPVTVSVARAAIWVAAPREA